MRPLLRRCTQVIPSPHQPVPCWLVTGSTSAPTRSPTIHLHSLPPPARSTTMTRTCSTATRARCAAFIVARLHVGLAVRCRPASMRQHAWGIGSGRALCPAAGPPSACMHWCRFLCIDAPPATLCPCNRLPRQPSAPATRCTPLPLQPSSRSPGGVLQARRPTDGGSVPAPGQGGSLGHAHVPGGGRCLPAVLVLEWHARL